MNPERFEDPGLKTALKRIYGGERAPADLRERLLRSLAEASPMSPISHSTVFTDRPIAAPLRMPFWSLASFRAAAAVFLIAVIGIFYYASNTSAASPIQHDALLAMIADHDHCCGAAAGHEDAEPALPVATLDRAAVGRKLADELNQTVWVPDLSQEGWRLAGAAVCMVKGKRSAHVIYAKGHNRLSVFSMSSEGCSGKDGACGQELNDHVIAGVARAGAVQCVVAHCPEKSIKQAHVNEILNRHQDELVTVAVASKTEQGLGQ